MAFVLLNNTSNAKNHFKSLDVGFMFLCLELEIADTGLNKAFNDALPGIPVNELFDVNDFCMLVMIDDDRCWFGVDGDRHRCRIRTLADGWRERIGRCDRIIDHR